MKKFLILLMIGIVAFGMCSCGSNNDSQGSENNDPVAITVDLETVSGYTTAIYEYLEAGMADVNNKPLVVAVSEECLEYSKQVNAGITYDVYRYTKYERSTAADGKNGDEALKAVDLYKTCYTVVINGDKLYFELEETDMKILESMDTVYPGIVHEMSEASSTEKMEIQSILNKLLPENNTIKTFKTANSIATLDKIEVAKVNDKDANIYKTADAQWEAATDANGLLFYGRSVKKTVLGVPAGQVYYPYLYTFTVAPTSITVDFTKIN